MKNYVPSHLKEMNRQVVFSLIKEKDMTSKAEIAKLTGISAPTVIKIVNYLIQKDLAVEVETEESANAVGRKPQMLSVNTKSMYVISFYLEGDYLSMGIVDLKGHVSYKKTMWIEPDFTYIMTEISENLIDLLLSEAGIGVEKLLGIGIALPCVYDSAQQVIITAPLIGIQEPLMIGQKVEKLRKKYDAAVMIENDVNAQVIGEYNEGGYGEKDDLILISIGTGLGCGVLLDGKLRRGKHYMCGEVGYFTSEEGDKRRNGDIGWLESKISYRTLEQKFGIRFHGQDMGIAGEQKKEIIQYITRHLAPGIHNIYALLDCDHVVLGGLVTEQLGKELTDTVNEQLQGYGTADRKVKLQSIENIGLIGIAAMVIRRKIKEVLSEKEE